MYTLGDTADKLQKTAETERVANSSKKSTALYVLAAVILGAFLFPLHTPRRSDW